jgi:hypothetical protein
MKSKREGLSIKDQHCKYCSHNRLWRKSRGLQCTKCKRLQT